MLSVGTRVIDLFDKEFSYTASSVINALHALWAEACVRFNIDVLKLYEALWLWGRGMCRIVNCRNCPLWKKKRGLRCEGRVSTRDYYGDNRGVQRIYPDRIVTPTSQYEFDFYLEAPEVANTGLYEDDPPEIYALMLKMAPRVVQEQLPLLL